MNQPKVEQWPSPAEIEMMTPEQFKAFLVRILEDHDWSDVDDWEQRRQLEIQRQQTKRAKA